MSPELGVRKARGEVRKHHHRRQERHDPLIPEPEGSHPPALDDRRPDELAQLGPVEPRGFGVRLVLEEPSVDRVAARPELRQMVDPAPNVEVVGVVDNGLGPQGEPLLSGTASPSSACNGT